MKSRFYWLRMRALLTCAGVLAVELIVGNSAHAQLRIVTYNMSSSSIGSPYTPRTGSDIVLKSIGEELVNGIAKPIDVLLVQEQNRLANSPDTQAIVDLLNTTYAGQSVTYARGNVIGGGDTTQSIIYRTQTVNLMGEVAFGTTSTSGMARQSLRYEVKPVGYDDSAALYIYNDHYKASLDSGTSTTNADRRNVEAQAIRADFNTLPLQGDGTGPPALYVGDHNFYNTASHPETAVQTLTAAGNGQAFDPLNRIGSWSGNSSFKDIDTQSPATTLHYPTQVLGGMDDRFDFQWATGKLLDGQGLSYINGSYHAFGNNGSTYNSNIDNVSNTYVFTGDTSYTKSQILGALAGVTDHLPVVADYRLPAKMSVAVGTVPARMIVGSTTNVGVTVTNSAPVSFSNGADTLAYSVQGTGIVTGTASGMATATLPGNLHNIAFSAGATAGHQTGSVGATTSSQQAAGASFSQSVAVDALDHSNGSFADGTDQDSLTIDFGQLTQAVGTQMQNFSLFNLVSTIGFTAKLDLDQIIAVGDTSILNTNASTFSNLAAGASQSLTAAFDTSMIGDFASTYTFKLSDEDVPGATTQTDLVLTLLGKVVSASLLGDYNGDGIVDAADYTVWRDSLGNSVTSGTGADGSSNGVVDQDDYDVWVAHFGDHSPGSAAGSTAAVPEPSAAFLLALGGCLIAWRGQRPTIKS
jgi:hypothetical protein